MARHRGRRFAAAAVGRIVELVERILADAEVATLLRAWTVSKVWRAAVERIFATRFRDAALGGPARKELRDGVVALAACPNGGALKVDRALKLVFPATTTFALSDRKGYAFEKDALEHFNDEQASWLERVIAEACAVGNFSAAADCLRYVSHNWAHLRDAPPYLLPGAALLGQTAKGTFALEAIRKDDGWRACRARGCPALEWLREVAARLEEGVIQDIEASVRAKKAAEGKRAKTAVRASHVAWAYVEYAARRGLDAFLTRAFRVGLPRLCRRYLFQSLSETRDTTHYLVALAANAGQARTVETLSLAGARCSRRTVLEAFESGRIQVIEACLRARARAPKEQCDLDFWHLGLRWAARRGHARVVRKYAGRACTEPEHFVHLAAFAAAGGHAPLMWWALRHARAEAGPECHKMLFFAAAGGQLALLRSLHEEHGAPLYPGDQPNNRPTLGQSAHEGLPAYEWAAGVAGAFVGTPYFGGYQEPKYHYRRLRETDAPFTPEREATLRWVLERLPPDWSRELAAQALEEIGEAKSYASRWYANRPPSGHEVVVRIAAELRACL